jgi:hypothetical protein
MTKKRNDKQPGPQITQIHTDKDKKRRGRKKAQKAQKGLLSARHCRHKRRKDVLPTDAHRSTPIETKAKRYSCSENKKAADNSMKKAKAGEQGPTKRTKRAKESKRPFTTDNYG